MDSSYFSAYDKNISLVGDLNLLKQYSNIPTMSPFVMNASCPAGGAPNIDNVCIGTNSSPSVSSPYKTNGNQSFANLFTPAFDLIPPPTDAARQLMAQRGPASLYPTSAVISHN